MNQESLLPGTYALTRGTVEWTGYHEKHLIRYRSVSGATWRQTYDDGEDAYREFWRRAEMLRTEALQILRNHHGGNN